MSTETDALRKRTMELSLAAYFEERKAERAARLTSASVEGGANTPAQTDTLSLTVRQTPFSLDAYPHIISTILDYLPLSTLTTMLRCSKSMQTMAERKSHRHLRRLHVTRGVAAMIGKPSKNRKIPRKLVELCQSVRIPEQHDSRALRTFIREHLSVRDIVLYPEPKGSQSRLHTPVSPNLVDLKARRLVIRYPDTYTSEGRNDYVDLSHVDESVRNVTLLVPPAWRSNGTWYSCVSNPPSMWDPASSSVDITVVLLPSLAGISVPASWSLPLIKQHYFPGDLADHAPGCPLRIVGAECIGLTSEVFDTIVERTRISGGEYEQEVAARLSVMSFIDWMDQQEPGAVMTGEEEDMYRKASRLILAGFGQISYRVRCVSHLRGCC